MKIISIVISLLFSLSLFSQTSGLVLDNEKNPISGASVLFADQNILVETNEKGEFLLKSIPYGEYVLRAQLLGYANFSTPLNVNSISVEVNPVLKESDNQIDEVVVSGTLKPISKSNSPVPVEVYSNEFFKKKSCIPVINNKLCIITT